MYNKPAKKANSLCSVTELKTKGVDILLGDPKKAIIKLAIPMIVAMSVQNIYQLIDTYWVSGLGADAMAAMGFVFPFFFVSMALSNGLGIGGGTAISRRIGAKDKEGADNVAVHTLILMLILVLIYSIPFYIFAPQLFTLVGAGKTTGLAVDYARVIFLGSIVVFFTNVANSIIRSEGDSKRAMQAMVLGAGLNIILDPIFIYTLDLGIAGAAWATLFSLAISSLMMFNWFFIKKNTYISFNFRRFGFKRDIVEDILRVGIPSSIQHITLSIILLAMNLIIIAASDTDGVAVFSTGWKVITVSVAPLMGVATAVVSVGGASFGARAFEKAEIALKYSIKLGLLIETGIALLIFALAPQIAAVFTRAETATHIAGDIEVFLRIVSIYLPTVGFGMLSSCIFQGAGKGMNALAATILRTFMTPLFAYIFALTLDLGEKGIWWGLITGNGISCMIIFVWARMFLSELIRTEHSIKGAMENVA
ncbi:Multi antimicrobial extrusion protein (Na(+)/drug antiporter), MATE family of MDR efflux pumps [Methanosarcina barkeri str. Wiesmoor]|uniref:Multi antimicrobial extrusion protein (Na(+)/drug antiporter), MATE family of MDR efflux pumps n=2 Tax=Methanosarcina barkeri TaxID=2208 RepID=A0A0E3QNF5_METBA|nr:MATE family efflux transporter [Methanosarcina barkeri]AKB51342.1 Multi antimicrobial extrusion protein (Na(+)/drug antiporter), MATE family of MDR efflux pumps [Methanosarcina barkeri str. Wiesmoor]